MKIVLLDSFTANPGDLSWDELKSLGDVTIYERTAPEKVLERAADADMILTNKVVIRKAEMEALPKLKYIGVLATGYNIIDIEEARRRGIVVTNIPAYSTASVAQIVFAHILNIANSVQHYSDEVRDGKWSSCADFSFLDTRWIELDGKTMGIVGLGNIGKAVARIALSFGMKVVAHTSKNADELPEGICKAESLEALFAQSDVVSLHCPLTDNTRNMVNAQLLSVMKPTAILVNTARGPLLDEQALADALNSKKILAAAIDVLSREPARSDNPLLTARNCFITPHIAWASFEARQRLMKILIDNIKGFISGNVINNVAR